MTPTISVGITVGHDVAAIEDLISRADDSMIERKRLLYSGTDRYVGPMPAVDPGPG